MGTPLCNERSGSGRGRRSQLSYDPTSSLCQKEARFFGGGSSGYYRRPWELNWTQKQTQRLRIETLTNICFRLVAAGRR
jgi:hypothetical protein